MSSFEVIGAQPVHLTLTVTDIDALMTAGHAQIIVRMDHGDNIEELIAALRKLAEALNA